MFKLKFRLFDINTNVTTQTGSGQDLSYEMKTFYDKVLIRAAEPELVHDQFAQKRPIPANSGKTIEFRKFSTLPKATTALTEGVTPDGQKYSVTHVEATIAQYGAYIAISDMLQLTAFDNNMAEITRMLGSQAGRTSDTITREVLAANTNFYFAGGAASAATAGNMSVDDVREAVNILKNNNAKKIDGYYVAIIHPDIEFDLMDDDAWISASEYAGSTQIFNGEIGKLYGVRFVESTEAKVGTTTSITDKSYFTQFLGADAYGVTSIDGKGIETIVKQKGSAGTADPLDQRATVGWKMNKAAEILSPEFIVTVISSSSHKTGRAAN